MKADQVAMAEEHEGNHMGGVIRWLRGIEMPRRSLQVMVALLILAALVDVGAFTKAYVARNADTVVIVVKHYEPQRSYLPISVTTLRYTGATAQKIQRAIDTASFVSGFQNFTCVGAPIGRTYNDTYDLTFTLAGVTVEAVNTSTSDCLWSRSILGWSEPNILLSSEPDPLQTIHQITNGALPL